MVATQPAQTPGEERGKFHLPKGFEIHLVASEPDIAKPLNMAFDARGRLWVSETVEYPYPAKDDNVARDRLSILEDTDGDGRADRFIHFAEHLNIPTGFIPTADGAIVYSIPYIYRYYDDDGDGRSDRREVLFGPFTYGDTHGMISSMTWGLDGWIYATNGFSNVSTVSGKDGHSIKLESGSIFRFRPDGSHIEHYTHGQVNPYGLSFDPMGTLFSADCHTRPIMQLLREAWYPEFGKPHDGLGFAPEICDHDHGSTAIAGIVYYTAEQFPPEYRDTIFTGNPVTNRINHDRIQPIGATCKAVHLPDFLVSDDPWFRPVNIQLAPDGSLYVADFYNRIIGHYEVALSHPGRDRRSGRIWRISYGGEKFTSIDWSKKSIYDLMVGLSHPNPAMRTQAANQIVWRFGQKAIEPVHTAASASNVFSRIHGLWILERLGGLEFPLLQSAAKDQDARVRVQVQIILANRKDWTTQERTISLDGLQDTDARVQRAATEALGHHPDPRNIEPLIKLRRKIESGDTHLIHSVRMAIRDQLAIPDSWALIAQSDHRFDDIIIDVAPGMPTEPAALFVLERLERSAIDINRLADYILHVARYVPVSDLVRLYTYIKSGKDFPKQVPLVEALNKGLQQRGQTMDADMTRWIDERIGGLLSGDAASMKVGVELAGKMKLKSQQDKIRGIAQTASLAPELRAQALDGLVAVQADHFVELLDRVLAGADQPMSLRERAASLLGQMDQGRAVDVLITHLRTAPARLALILARSLSKTPPGGQRLLDEITAGKASAQLLMDREIDVQLRQTGSMDVEKRIEALAAGIGDPEEPIQKLIEQRKAGFATAKTDVRRGAAIFEKNCAICHRIGALGQKFAPELDGVGVRGIDRLLEDTLDPSRNVDQAFRTTIVELDDGVTQTGLLKGTEGTALTLIDSKGQPIIISTSQIKEQRISKLSPMPSNVATDLPEQDYYDLLAFLLSQLPTGSGPQTQTSPAAH